MSIILRTNKGSALTYDEMDRNQSQFYYSSSLSPDSSEIRLHFTGSDNLDTTEDFGPNRYDSIPFPSVDTTIEAPSAADPHTAIQFNRNGNFGADPLFVFLEQTNFLGIATSAPTDRLDIQGDGSKGASITLRGRLDGNVETGTSKINFNEGQEFIGRLGRTDIENKNIYITNNYKVPQQIAGPTRGDEYGKVHVSIGDPGEDDLRVVGTFWKASGILRFGVGTKEPNRMGTFVGGRGIGISNSELFEDTQSIIKPIPSQIYLRENSDGLHSLIPNNSDSNGLLISSPEGVNGGNIVIAINTNFDGASPKNEGFNIINASEGSYTTSEVIASFQANGKVGINTNFPSDVGLTVDGNISGSGTLQVETIDTGTSANTKTLIATSTGLVKQIAAAPVPLGGIIMWSGTIATIPDGWTLCDGDNTGYSITVPDLTNKFIMGAGDTYNPDNTGGNNTYTPSGYVTPDRLTTEMIPRHTHMHLDDDHTYVANVSGYGPGSPSSIELDKYGGGTGDFNSAADINGYDSDSGNSNSGNRQAFHTGVNTTSVRGTTVQDSLPDAPTATFYGNEETNNNIPEFYALAYIIYVGV